MKRIEVKISLFILIFIILFISFISAGSDIKSSYNETTKTITIFDKDKINKISEVKLNTDLFVKININDNTQCLGGVGKRCIIAEYEIHSEKDYNKAFGNLEFFDVNSNMKLMQKEYILEYRLKNGIKDVYGEVCNGTGFFYSNGTEIKQCNLIGQEQLYRWSELESEKKFILNSGNYTIRILTDVSNGEVGEWIATLFDKRIEEWAVYSGFEFNRLAINNNPDTIGGSFDGGMSFWNDDARATLMNVSIMNSTTCEPFYLKNADRTQTLATSTSITPLDAYGYKTAIFGNYNLTKGVQYWILCPAGFTDQYGGGRATPYNSGNVTWNQSMNPSTGLVQDNDNNNYNIIGLTLGFFDVTPLSYLSSPLNGTFFSTSTLILTCNSSDPDGSLKNTTFYVWNSTNDLVNFSINLTSGFNNVTTFNVTNNFTGTYHWNCLSYNANNISDWADNNFTFVIDLTNTLVTLNYPSNNQWINNFSNVYFNYTPTHINQNIDTCDLYGNFTGTWHKNSTDTTITKDIVNYFSLNLTDGSYIWNVRCNSTDTGNSQFALLNYSLNIDTFYPNVTINNITTTLGSQTVSFSSNASDLNTLSCKYSIFNSSGEIDGTNNNVSFVCNVNRLATVSAFGDYNLTIYAKDLAGNENSSLMSFITSTSPISPPSGGGGSTQELEKIPSIAIKEIVSNVKYTSLDRSVFFARINDYCSTKKGGTALAVQDFSGTCSLTKDDLTIIKNGITSESFVVSLEDLISFYQKYNLKDLEQSYFTLEEIKTFKLYTSVLGITNPMMINPPRLDRPFIKFFSENNGLIEYSFTSNKDIRDCSVLSGNFRCNLLSNTTFKVTLDINDTNFFDKIFNGEISVTSSADPKNLEVKRVSLYPRVYNLYYTFAGIPVIVFLVLAVVILLITSIFFIRRGKIKKGIWRNR